MDDLEYHSLASRAALIAADTTLKPDEQRNFRRLAKYADTCAQQELRARLPKRPPIVFDVKRGVVSDLAGDLHCLPNPKLKGWRVVDFILCSALGTDLNFPGCAALLTDGGKQPDNTLRNQCNRVASLLRPINKHLAVAIKDGIKVARNGAIALDYRDIPAITTNS